MRILVVSHEFPPIGGGGASACYYLSDRFIRQGNVVHVITANFRNMPREEEANGIMIHRVDSIRMKTEYSTFVEMLSYMVLALKRSEKLQHQYNFDVCVINFGIPSGPIGYVLKQKYNLPYIIRFGGGDIPGFQERFKVVYKLLKMPIKAIWEKADALIVNSEGLKEMAQGFYDKPAFTVINNGVDSDYFTPNKARSNSGEIVLLFVSRLIERKGLQYIIPLLPEIRRRVKKSISLMVVGDGPYRPALERIVYQNDVRDIVKFVGQKKGDELLSYYQRADIFVFPSKKEGMPNVVLEAMACGLPIVMTPCQGAWELIDGNGYVSLVDHFVDDICKLVNSDRLREECGRTSRERAVRLFSWETVTKKYLNIMANSEQMSKSNSSITGRL